MVGNIYGLFVCCVNGTLCDDGELATLLEMKEICYQSIKEGIGGRCSRIVLMFYYWTKLSVGWGGG